MQWYGLIVPACTPPGIVERLYEVMNAALASEEVRNRLAEEGAILDLCSAQDFAAVIATELERWGGLVRRQNLQPGE